MGRDDKRQTVKEEEQEKEERDSDTTVKEEEQEKEERDSDTTVKNCLDSCVRRFQYVKNQLIKAALMTYNN